MVRECSSLEPRDCYNKYYATTCCKTCKGLVQNPSGAACLYGDKGVGCSELLPEVCHLSSRFCCHTCAAYLELTNKTATSPAQLANKTASSTTTALPTRGKWRCKCYWFNIMSCHNLSDILYYLDQRNESGNSNTSSAFPSITSASSTPILQTTVRTGSHPSKTSILSISSTAAGNRGSLSDSWCLILLQVLFYQLTLI